MHIIENYSRRSGAEIDKPFVLEHYYPVPEKYITIQNSSGMPAKNYDYFQEVLEEIAPKLISEGYVIIQLGNKEDQGLEFCAPLQGITSLNQTAYILRNSSLHISNDSFSIHLCSSLGTPLIALYSISPPEICGPWWKNDKQIVLEPDLQGKKYSFNPNENPKMVNTIKIEDIVSSINKLLGKNDKKSFSSIWIGEKFKARGIELIPNEIINNDFAPELPITIRADLIKELNDNIVLLNLRNRKSIVICDSRFKEVQGFTAFKSNLLGLVYDFTNEDFNFDFVNGLVKEGLLATVIYRGEDEQKVLDAKVQLIELGLHFIHIKPNKEKLEKLSNLLDNNKENNVWIKTNRIILSDKKVYPTIQHWKEGKNTTTKELKLEIDNTLEFLKEEEFLYIYVKT